MDENVGNSGSNNGGSGFSLFFLTSSTLSVFNAWRNGQTSIEDAMKDEEFQLELEQQRRAFDRKKIAEEQEFKKWILQRQREYARIETARKLDLELSREDLKMFFDNWPLKIAIDTINKENKNKDGTGKFYVVIGKHITGKSKDVLTQNYNEIVDFVQYELKRYNDNIVTYRFKDENLIVDGAALAYIYAMMNTRPTVVLLPRIRDKKLIISVGCWNQDSLFPYQKDAFAIDYEEMLMKNDVQYFSAKKEEIQLLLTTISQVLYDNYFVLESSKKPVFPLLVQSHDLAKKYPYLLDFARNEYGSLCDNDSVCLKDADNQNAQQTHCDDDMRRILTNAINSLTK